MTQTEEALIAQVGRLREALTAIMQAHKFNVHRMPASEVHAIAFAALEGPPSTLGTVVEGEFTPEDTSRRVSRQQLPMRLVDGDTYQSGDCGYFQAGIHVDDWFQRIVVYGSSAEDAEQLRDSMLRVLTLPKRVPE